ncbi:MAG: GerMN domain-containing protein [Candidatus Aminicenantes bacterium]|nr:GerMN domain-containing protein [Candidatus Aminicenantes bacterium]
MPKSTRAVLIPILAVAVVGLAVFFFLSDNRESIKKARPGAGPTAEEGTSPADSRPKRTVNLLFLRDESDALIPEAREIVADPSSPAFEAREILGELLKGSQSGLLSTVPPETKLIQVYITKDGTAYVDFSREFADRHPSGSNAEIATIYAVVDSLAYNLKSVKKVCLLVDGEERETLAGHIAINHPILPDFSMIAAD